MNANKCKKGLKAIIKNAKVTVNGKFLSDNGMINTNKMPQGVGAIQLIQAFSTFSYAILYSSLTLYIVKQLGLPQASANNIFGAFLAFNYVLHLLGGMLAGKHVSNRNLFFITTIFQMAGISLLSFASVHYLYMGLSLFLLGCGINTTCLNTMLTLKFNADDARREKAFFINYSAMNVGFFLGYLLSGFFDGSSQYQNLFLIGSLSNLITIAVMWASWPSLKEETETTNSKQSYFIYTTLLGLSVLLSFCLNYAEFSNHLVMALSAITLLSLFFMSFKQKKAIDTQKIRAFLILTITSIIFWMIYFTGPMGITLFIKNNVDRQIAGFTVATQWFSNINSIIVIIGSPLVALLIERLKAKGLTITITQQFVTAFILLSISFYSLSAGVLTCNALGMTSVMWLIIHIFFQGMGELLIGPVGYAMIGRLAPGHLQSFFMGTWMMVSGVSATLSNYFSNMMVKTNALDPLITNMDYYHVFNQLGAWAIAGAIVLMVLSSILYRQIESAPHNNIKAHA